MRRTLRLLQPMRRGPMQGLRALGVVQQRGAWGQARSLGQEEEQQESRLGPTMSR